MRRFALPVLLAVAVAASGCQTLNDVTGIGSAKPSEAPIVAPPAAIGTAGNIGTGASPTLSGMTGETLRSLWGEPTLKRAETGAELWQYSGQGGCTLLVYLYSGAGSAMIVSHAEASPGGADEAAIAACAKASGKPPLKPIS